MSTPTEYLWRGVSELPDYKQTFPHWTKDRLEEVVGKYMDAEGVGLLREMLAYDPAERISAKRLLKRSYFDDVDRSTLPAGNYDGSTMYIAVSGLS
ncbi:unnamed protein product [Gongylonema pulchrum]|uniref:S-adenosyl-L-methionine-dependent methyltransferase n=1 Tax=Gongylonema pulchrum TaxID=637853 RepID=A0A183E4Z6_9BILA|nr:unnamed protein product [Gongylonema pulchrum]